MALVLDTGPLVALADRDDPDHERCAALIRDISETLVIPDFVLVEVDYWLRKLAGATAWRTFTGDIAAGAYQIHHADGTEIARAAELEARYESIALGLVDAAVIAACERLDETKVASLDRHDFSVVRPNHCRALTILPE
jgi:predicted nucleic acid-binding protein